MVVEFKAVIERSGKRIFEFHGEKELEEILLELDFVVKREIERKE